MKKAALGIPPYKGTSITFQFMNKYSVSCQAHLEQISSFAIHGEDSWWINTGDGIQFF